MIKFEYDDEGNLIVYKNGKRIGKINTVGNDIAEEGKKDGRSSGNKSRQ